MLGFLILARGPALPPRALTGVPALGVPGPRDDCRRLEDGVGRLRWAFKRRRLASVAPWEDSRTRCCRWMVDAGEGAECWLDVFDGWSGFRPLRVVGD